MNPRLNANETNLHNKINEMMRDKILLIEGYTKCNI